MAAGYLALNLMNLEHRARRLELRRAMRERRDQYDPFEWHDDVFIDKYRIHPENALHIIEELGPYLEKERSYGLSVESQVLTALRFYATGSYQGSTGDSFDIPMSQPSVSRCVTFVSSLINEHLFRPTVRFPMTQAERYAAKEKFRNAPQPFENTLGAIDCTYIHILAPSEHEEAFVNHWGDHCLNVQAVVDPDLQILNVNPRFPGARNDYYIWNNSAAKRVMQRNFENGERNTWIIGDDGYFVEPWLMTPLKHEHPGTPRFIYNDALCSARSVVERTFGVWKSVFRCLSSQRKLMYNPVMAGKIINSCAVLHNLRIANNIADIPINPVEINAERERNLAAVVAEENQNQARVFQLRAQAERIQTSFINRLFGARRRQQRF